jgi:hypothetical protein
MHLVCTRKRLGARKAPSDGTSRPNQKNVELGGRSNEKVSRGFTKDVEEAYCLLIMNLFVSNSP